MCVAELNVSLLPCRHRWYHLARPCSPAANLATCDGKLGLSGWEIKCDFCPYCAEWSLPTAEYRLVGNDRSARTPSLTLVAARRESRRGDLCRVESDSSVREAQEKNRAMIARVDAYFNRAPPESSIEATSQTASRDVDDDEGSSLTPSTSETCSSDASSERHPSTASTKSDLFKKVRKQSKRLSMSMFNVINPAGCMSYDMPDHRVPTPQTMS